MAIEFFIPMLCEAKQTKGNRIVKTATGRTFVARYTPAKVKHNSASLAAMMVKWIPSKPLEGPIGMAVWFHYPWLKGATRKQKASGQCWKDTKPDLDNLFKNLADTMQGCGFFRNDSQIADVRLVKCWSERPGVEVRIEAMNGKVRM